MKTLLVKNDKPILRVSMNRPEVRNAFHPDMIAELTKVFKDVAKDKSIRVIQLSGEGKSFCAGADLGWMKSMAKFKQAENIKDAGKLFEMFQVIRDCPAPIVTKVHGHVMGGALGLVAVSDLVVAEENTQFCFSEVKLGLAPAVISAFVKDKISASAMSRWFLTGDIFFSQDALNMGLIHAVGGEQSGEQSTDAQVITWTKSLLRNGPEAVKETKKLIAKVGSLKTDAQLKTYTSKLIAKLRVGAEGQEGLRSALEQGKPSHKEPSWRLGERESS